MAAMLVQVLIVSTLATLASSAVPSDYTLYQGLGYYKLYTTRRTWSDAWKTCKDEGSNLLVINSKREADAVKTHYALDKTVLEGAWMGIHDLFVENEFVTTFGYPLSMAGYARWKVGEPNNANGNENCILVYRDGDFNDDKCDKLQPFFCEA